MFSVCVSFGQRGVCYLETVWVEKSSLVSSTMADSSASFLQQNSDFVQVSEALWGAWAPSQAQGDSPLVTRASHSSSPLGHDSFSMSRQYGSGQ